MKPHRIQLKRVKGWRMPANTVKVARPSIWGNPFTIGAPDPHSGKPMTRGDAIARFEQYAGQTPIEKRIISHLRGKNLACFCRIGEPCHADTLLRIANEP
jgi:hypothetical protein